MINVNPFTVYKGPYYRGYTFIKLKSGGEDCGTMSEKKISLALFMVNLPFFVEFFQNE